jgi:hypothetical protein
MTASSHKGGRILALLTGNLSVRDIDGFSSGADVLSLLRLHCHNSRFIIARVATDAGGCNIGWNHISSQASQPFKHTHGIHAASECTNRRLSTRGDFTQIFT